MAKKEAAPAAITSDNYAEATWRTSCDYDLVKFRLNNGAVLYDLQHFMEESRILGQKFDVLKKYLISGKDRSGGRYTHSHNAVNPSDAPIVVKYQDDLAMVVMHAGLGLQTETSEFLAPLYNHIYRDKELDVVNLLEESGDAEWYLGHFFYKVKKTMTEVLQANFNKLKARFPEKFTGFLCENRNVKAERELLEQELVK